MTPMERIDTAMSGGIPDRVPFVPKIWIDLAAALTGVDLVDTISDPLLVLDTIARAGEAVGADAARMFHFPERRTETVDGVVYDLRPDGSRRGSIDMAGGLQTHLEDPSEFRLEDPRFTGYHHFYTADEPFVRSESDAARIHVPPRSFYEEEGWGDRQRIIFERVGDRIGLFGDCSSATLAFYVCLRKMDRALMDLIDSPGLVHRVMEKGVAIAVEKGKFNLDLGLKTLRLNDSVGNMSVISADHWREFVYPHMKAVCDELHAYDRDARIYCHICGNLLPIIEDLERVGLDCIAPLDPLGGFTCAAARKAVSDTMPLMGGIDTLSFVSSTSEEIRQEASRCICEAGARGAFILGSGCVVPRGARASNLKAVSELVRAKGAYRDGVIELCPE